MTEGRSGELVDRETHFPNLDRQQAPRRKMSLGDPQERNMRANIRVTGVPEKRGQ